MARVIQFPKVSQVPLVRNERVASDQVELGVVRALNLGVWMVAVLVWPLVRWLMALDVFWHFGLMVFRGGGLQFAMHLLCFAAAHYYVAVYRPQGVERVLQGKKFSR